MRRLLPWVWSIVICAIGLGFVAAALVQSAAADAYRNARNCPDTASPNCYQLSPGTIRSVSVSQTRSGEEDTTVIETKDTSVTVILQPSASAAPHVRSGAAVTVEWYQGKVVLIGVDGLGVSSLDNPGTQQSRVSYYGIVILAVGGVGILLQVRASRRRAQRAAGVNVVTSESALPTGTSGWIVRPSSLGLSSIGRPALAIAGLLILSGRILADPSRRARGIAFDAAILVAGAFVLGLYLINSKLIVDRHEVTRIDWLGRSATYSTSSIKHVDRFRSATSNYLVFAGHDGRQLFRVAGGFWDYDRLSEICREVGLELVGGFDELVSGMGINKRAGSSTNWIATGGLLLVLIVAGFAYVALLAGPTSR